MNSDSKWQSPPLFWCATCKAYVETHFKRPPGDMVNSPYCKVCGKRNWDHEAYLVQRYGYTWYRIE